MSEIYQPSEDSFLMSRILKQQLPNLLEKNPGLKFLEIGAGSGINLQTGFESGIKKENIFSSDIDINSVNHCNSLGFHCVKSNLFEKFDMRFPSRRPKVYTSLASKPRARVGLSLKEIASQEQEGKVEENRLGCLQFDLIIFNPPYLPEDKREPKDSQLQTTGGKKGNEIINEFLKQAKNHLEPDGKIFLITSSLSPEINWRGYKKKLLGKEKLFFERLCIFEIKSKR